MFFFSLPFSFVTAGVFVLGAGQQGILLEHREKEFGDYADITEVLEAAMRIQPKGKDQGKSKL